MDKICTDIEQSKKLAEILPLESADMSYTLDFNSGMYGISTTSYKRWIVPKYAQPDNGFGQVIPCWSLAALLSVLPRIDIEKEIWFDDTYDYRVKAYIDDGYVGDWFDNPIDACYDMIIKLHEDKLL